jgi:hypothetical protein
MEVVVVDSVLENKMVADWFKRKNCYIIVWLWEEDSDYEKFNDIDLLASDWTTTMAYESWWSEGVVHRLFWASTGAASALRAAAYFGDTIKAVVSRGGRPDLALSALDQVTAQHY